MAFLVPLLLPGILNATANIALGVTNAVQGTSSDVSFKIGNQVLTTKKPFNFSRFPPEIREKIILLALEASRSLIIPAMDILPPTQPFGPIRFDQNTQRYNPLNPDSMHYRSIVGEMFSANGYPLSSWRWMTLCKEWRDLIRRHLWKHLVISGHYSYFKFKRLMDRENFNVLKLVEKLELHQGYGEPPTLYAIITHPHLTALHTLSIMPIYPFSPAHFEEIVQPFEFGLQLIKAPKLKVVDFGLPLEMCSNATQRNHLKDLALERLAVTVLIPSHRLFNELKGLISEVTPTLSIRYLASSSRELADPSLFVSEPLNAFTSIELHFPRMVNHIHPFIGRTDEATTFVQRILDLVQSDEENRRRYSVFVEDDTGQWIGNGGRSEVCLYKPEGVAEVVEEGEEERAKDEPGMEFLTTEEREEIRRQKARDETAAKEAAEAEGSSKAPSWAMTSGGKGKEREVKKGDESWERETNLSILGGFISLRLESKKH